MESTQAKPLRLTSGERLILGAGLSAALARWNLEAQKGQHESNPSCVEAAHRLVQAIEACTVSGPADVAALPIDAMCLRHAAAACLRYESAGIQALAPSLHDIALLVDALFANKEHPFATPPTPGITDGMSDLVQ
jgi:hypothetical protein